MRTPKRHYLCNKNIKSASILILVFPLSGKLERYISGANKLSVWDILNSNPNKLMSLLKTFWTSQHILETYVKSLVFSILLKQAIVWKLPALNDTQSRIVTTRWASKTDSNQCDFGEPSSFHSLFHHFPWSLKRHQTASFLFLDVVQRTWDICQSPLQSLHQRPSTSVVLPRGQENAVSYTDCTLPIF